jgi:hypothetical protein
MHPTYLFAPPEFLHDTQLHNLSLSRFVLHEAARAFGFAVRGFLSALNLWNTRQALSAAAEMQARQEREARAVMWEPPGFR